MHSRAAISAMLILGSHGSRAHGANADAVALAAFALLVWLSEKSRNAAFSGQEPPLHSCVPSMSCTQSVKIRTSTVASLRVSLAQDPTYSFCSMCRVGGQGFVRILPDPHHKATQTTFGLPAQGQCSSRRPRLDSEEVGTPRPIKCGRKHEFFQRDEACKVCADGEVLSSEPVGRGTMARYGPINPKLEAPQEVPRFTFGFVVEPSLSPQTFQSPCY